MYIMSTRACILHVYTCVLFCHTSAHNKTVPGVQHFSAFHSYGTKNKDHTREQYPDSYTVLSLIDSF